MSKQDGWPAYLHIGESITIQCESCNAVFSLTNEPEQHVQDAPEEFPESENRMVGFCPFCGSNEVFLRDGDK